ncbi:unnamed protein product [Adineta steineri]|uniref:Apple domain-containing protein n=1 Tax=Adineta steineri TaxID=433720 RepID=A0A815J673_9BILA|nr:unnamed protein product [Adineta steineri]CAF4092053.1 unnamed protein product [Adineta steineri]
MVSPYRHLLFTLFILIISQTLETTTNIWQAIFDVSNLGLEFSPADEQALLLLDTTARSLLNCAQMCEMIARCRTFNYDIQIKHCRLYQGDIDSTGEVVPSVSSQSVCGSIKLIMENFADYGGPCSICDGSRYLTCINLTCQCQPNTFFNGSMCRSQKLIGGGCTSDNQCRNDLNLKCLLNNQCGSIVLLAVHPQQAQLVAVHQLQARPLVVHQLQVKLLLVHQQPVQLLVVHLQQVRPLVLHQLQAQPLAVHQQQAQPLAAHQLQVQPPALHQQQVRPLAVQLLQAQLLVVHPQQVRPLVRHQLQAQPLVVHQQQLRPLAVQQLQAQLLALQQKQAQLQVVHQQVLAPPQLLPLYQQQQQPDYLVILHVPTKHGTHPQID